MRYSTSANIILRLSSTYRTRLIVVIVSSSGTSAVNCERSEVTIFINGKSDIPVADKSHATDRSFSALPRQSGQPALFWQLAAFLSHALPPIRLSPEHECVTSVLFRKCGKATACEMSHALSQRLRRESDRPFDREKRSEKRKVKDCTRDSVCF